MKLTYTNVNGYLISNLTYKSGEQMVWVRAANQHKAIAEEIILLRPFKAGGLLYIALLMHAVCRKCLVAFLEAAYISYKLQIEIVLISALHRLDIA